MSKIQFTPVPSPATPDTGKVVLYVDTSDTHIKTKDGTGTVHDLAGTVAQAIISNNTSQLTVTSGTSTITLSPKVFPALAAGSANITVVSGANTITIDLSNTPTITTLTATTVTGTTGQFSGTVSAQTGSFSTNLSVSGTPVNIKSSTIEHFVFNTFSSISGSIASWTNMPAAPSFFLSQPGSVQQVDLSNFNQVRLNTTIGPVGGATGTPARMGVRYRPSTSSPTFTSTITEANWPSISVGDTCSVPVTGTNWVWTSGWRNMVPGAQQDVILAVIGSGGDGAVDPTIGMVSVDLRIV